MTTRELSKLIAHFLDQHCDPRLFPWQQEELLLSVLPKYIAVELKGEVIKNLTKPKSNKEDEPKNSHNFHSLFVRQHKDVR